MFLKKLNTTPEENLLEIHSSIEKILIEYIKEIENNCNTKTNLIERLDNNKEILEDVIHYIFNYCINKINNSNIKDSFDVLIENLKKDIFSINNILRNTKTDINNFIQIDTLENEELSNILKELKNLMEKQIIEICSTIINEINFYSSQLKKDIDEVMDVLDENNITQKTKNSTDKNQETTKEFISNTSKIQLIQNRIINYIREKSNSIISYISKYNIDETGTFISDKKRLIQEFSSYLDINLKVISNLNSFFSQKSIPDIDITNKETKKPYIPNNISKMYTEIKLCKLYEIILFYADTITNFNDEEKNKYLKLLIKNGYISTSSYHYLKTNFSIINILKSLYYYDSYKRARDDSDGNPSIQNSEKSQDIIKDIKIKLEELNTIHEKLPFI